MHKDISRVIQIPCDEILGNACECNISPILGDGDMIREAIPLNSLT